MPTPMPCGLYASLKIIELVAFFGIRQFFQIGKDTRLGRRAGRWNSRQNLSLGWYDDRKRGRAGGTKQAFKKHSSVHSLGSFLHNGPAIVLDPRKVDR
jgi:hypothetical protein